MEENNENKNEENVNTEEIKEEVKETPVEKKESTKNTNSKKDAKIAKDLATNFFKTPFTELKKVVTNPKSYLKIAIIIFVIWIVAECIGSVIYVFDSFNYSPYYNLGAFIRNSLSDFFAVVKAILVPAISVALLSGIVYLLMKNKKKSYLTILITIIIAEIPVVISSIISLFGYIGTQASMITSSVTTFCTILSTIFIYYAIKELYEEKEDDKIFMTFLITMAIYYGIALILKFFTIYI